MGRDKRGCFWFWEVQAEKVREPVRRTAIEMLAHVERDLRLRGLNIRWFRCIHGWAPKEIWGDLLLNNIGAPRNINGIHMSNIPVLIWVRATLSLFTTALVVAHEARHAWQQRCWGPSPGDKDWEHFRYRERDADDYECKMALLAFELEEKHKRRKEK